MALCKLTKHDRDTLAALGAAYEAAAAAILSELDRILEEWEEELADDASATSDELADAQDRLADLGVVRDELQTELELPADL